MTNTALSEPTYDERARQMTAQQREELKAVLTQKAHELQQLVATNQFTAVRGVNVAREIGAQIELFTGHEKLLPADFNPIAPSMALAEGKDATLDFAKTCLALHRKFKEPVTDFKVAKDEWDTLMVQMDLLPKPERGPATGPGLDEPVKEYIGSVIKVDKEALKVLKDHPFEQWPRFYVEQFYKESQNIHELHVKAARTLGKA